MAKAKASSPGNKSRPPAGQRKYRGKALRPLSGSFLPLTGPALRKRGFAEARIVTQWPEIAGPAIATASTPLKISPGRGGGRILLIRVTSAAALEIQHQTPVILDRINAFFGFDAITGLKLVQGPVTAVAPRKKPAPATLTSQGEEKLSKSLSGLNNSTLKSALEALGREIYGRNQPKS